MDHSQILPRLFLIQSLIPLSYAGRSLDPQDSCKYWGTPQAKTEMAIPQCCLSPLTEESSTQSPNPSLGQRFPQFQSLLNPFPSGTPSPTSRPSGTSAIWAFPEWGMFSTRMTSSTGWPAKAEGTTRPASSRINIQVLLLLMCCSTYLHQAHVKGPGLNPSGRTQTPASSSGAGSCPPAAGLGTQR